MSVWDTKRKTLPKYTYFYVWISLVFLWNEIVKLYLNLLKKIWHSDFSISLFHIKWSDSWNLFCNVSNIKKYFEKKKKIWFLPHSTPAPFPPPSIQESFLFGCFRIFSCLHILHSFLNSGLIIWLPGAIAWNVRYNFELNSETRFWKLF